MNLSHQKQAIADQFNIYWESWLNLIYDTVFENILKTHKVILAINTEK